MAKKNFLVDIDLNKNELQNGVIQNLSADPENGKKGQLYYNTLINKLRVFNGTEWMNLEKGDGTVSSVTINANAPLSVNDSSAIISSGTRTLSHNTSGAVAGSYGDSSSQTPSYGETFKVPYISVDTYGHVTGISEHTVKIPNSDNTDTTYTLSQGVSDGHQIILTSSSGSPQSVTVPDNDTTYTLSADTTNNVVVLTPSSGSEQSITVPYATRAGSATTATSATKDGSGNVITSTYYLASNPNGYTTNTGTVTSVFTGAGLTGGPVTTTGTVKANLKSETLSTLEAADMGTTASRQYAVGLDVNGKLSVNIPWKNDNTKTTAGATDTSDLIYIVGAKTQTTNPTTYTQDTAYVGSDGHLYSNSKQVVNLSDTQALTNKTYNGYTLGNASEKTVDETIGISSTSDNLPTSAAVATFVEGKGYTTNVGTITEVQANGTSVATSGIANIPSATTSKYGVTKLSDAINSTSTTLAATANAVKTAYDLAASKTDNVGTITGVSMNGTSIATSGVANITSVPASILSGAIANGVTATTQSQGDNSTKVATTAYVDTAIDALPEPMIFKGSLGEGGTITELPAAASSNVGYTYKVITAGTYASQTAKVGDTFVSDGSAWILIPSGDEPSGTVTSITIKATSPIAVNSSSAITTSGTRTISHATSGATAGSYGDSTAQTPSYSGTFKVPYITVNDTGHVTGISEHTVTIPASDNTTYSLSADTTNNKITLTPSSGTADSITVPYATKAGQLSNSKTINGVGFNGTSNITITANPTENQLTNQDLDTVTTPGLYYAGGGNSVTNKPGSGVNAFALWVFKTASGYLTQDLIEGDTHKGKRWTRQYEGTSGGWKEWGYIYSTITPQVDITGNAATATLATSATSATNDGSGNVIADTYVKKTGDTMTGALTVPQVNTGTNTANYFQSQKFRGEGNASTYYHAIDFGYSGHNQVDFYEYGGIYNFHKHTGSAIDSGDTLLGKITTNGWEGNVVGNVTGNVTGTASMATGDKNGDDITTKYVTIDTTQTITGEKTFTQKINLTSASNITYDATSECIKFVFV